MGKASNFTITGTLIKEILSTGKQKEKAFINGQMEKFMMASGKADSNMGTACGKGFTETPILENGNNQKQMGTEFIFGKTEIVTKENGETV